MSIWCVQFDVIAAVPLTDLPPLAKGGLPPRTQLYPIAWGAEGMLCFGLAPFYARHLRKPPRATSRAVFRLSQPAAVPSLSAFPSAAAARSSAPCVPRLEPSRPCTPQSTGLATKGTLPASR